MQEVIIATLVVGVIGLLIGVALVAVSKKFAVETDERVGLVRESLPGNNCGAAATNPRNRGWGRFGLDFSSG